MINALKRILGFCLLLVLVLGIGYGLYYYFTDYRVHSLSNNVLNETQVSREYLDTLVLDINTMLKDITQNVHILSQNFKNETFGFTIMSCVLFFNLILTVILCFLVLGIRSKYKDMSKSGDF